MSYDVPAFKYNHRLLVGLAAHKNFMSLYPASGVIEHYEAELDGFKLSKGAIRFTVDKPLSSALLKKIVLYRLKDISK